MIFSYNKAHVGDVLLVIVADDKGQENKVERKGNVAKITVEKTGEIVAWNIFQVSEWLPELTGSGQVMLSDAALALLNQAIQASGFSETLQKDHTPKLVIGLVKSCEKHPDSDHLSITQTEVDQETVLQIVCGAPNIQAGQKVVVAKPGAMMPDGLMIWPNELRGVKSFGMICSAKELRLPNAPEKKGILVLPADAKVGEAFSLNN